jgi:NodT family efflux transporter outer membrane factor (OMF) lipoprotein
MLMPLQTACSPHTVEKDVQPLVAGGASYSFPAEGVEPRDRWWEAWNDRFVNALVEETLSENLTLRQAFSRVDQARAADVQARSFLYPEVTGEASGSQEWRGEGKPEDNFSLGFRLSWEVDLWGRLSSAQKSAAYEVRASREELQATALVLTAEVAETYFQILEQKLQIALLEGQITVGETLLELTELRFAYGAASVVDVFQQRQQLASTRAQIPIAFSRLGTLENRLHVLRGKAPTGGPLRLADDFPQLPPLPSTGVPLDLLADRPDLRGIHDQLVAFDYRVAEAVADRLPRVRLDGSGGVRDRLATEDLFFSLLLDAVAPMLDWDRRKAEVEKRRAVFEEELARYSEAYLTAIEEVEPALCQERRQLELLEATEKEIAIARANLTATRNRYAQGLTDYLPVLAAIQSLQNLEREIITRDRQLISIRILLYRALGGSPLTTEDRGTPARDETAAVRVPGGLLP